MIPISVLILTRNEENNLPKCLRSVTWSDDVVVLDSTSTDRTLEVARQSGCRTASRAFDNWSAHQNWAVRNIEFKYPWVLNLDADEGLAPEAVAELGRLDLDATAYVAFRMRRKDYFRGTWLKHATFYPTWLVRLYRPDKVSFSRLVNPITHVDGEVGRLDGHIDHWPFSKGISHWISRHDAYSTFEAQEYSAKPRSSFKDLISADPNRRRAAMKALFTMLPARPALKFFYLYFVHGGFMDGKAGLDYCVLQSVYEYFIGLKLKELSGDAS